MGVIMKFGMPLLFVFQCLLVGCCFCHSFEVREKGTNREIIHSCEIGERLFQISVSNDFLYSVRYHWHRNMSVFREYDIASKTVSEYEIPVRTFELSDYLAVADRKLFLAIAFVGVEDYDLLKQETSRYFSEDVSTNTWHGLWVAPLDCPRPRLRYIPGVIGENMRCRGAFVDCSGNLILLLWEWLGRKYEMIRFDIHNEKIISRCAWMRPNKALGNDKAEISPDGKYICVGVGDALQVFDCGLKRIATLRWKDLLHRDDVDDVDALHKFAWTDKGELTIIDCDDGYWCTYDVSSCRVSRKGRIRLEPEGKYQAELVYEVLGSGVFFKARNDKDCCPHDAHVIKVGEDGNETELGNGKLLHSWWSPNNLTPDWYYEVL